LHNLQLDLGYTFRDAGLLERAFTHTSYAHEHSLGAGACNERLEFLGDAVLELCVSDLLYSLFPKAPEGQLTKRRAGLVCEPTLAALARSLGLGGHMRLGHGEALTGGRDKGSLLSDVFEAVLGAIYLDGGLEPARRVVARLFTPLTEETASLRDNKTTLQEILQKNGRETAVYTIVSEYGPPHKRAFVAQVSHMGKVLGEGTGGSKKEAEQNAAAIALDEMPVDKT
jgi:ribonuclease-3